MEFDILHLHRLPSCRAPCGLEHHLVVQSQPQLRHPAQVALQLHGPEDLAAQHIPRRADQQVQTLNHIQEDLILAIPDPLTSPANRVRDRDGRPRLHLQLMALLRDVLLQDLGLGGLRVAEIHHLVEELVDDDEVVADGFLLEGFEVFGEDGDEAVEEEEEGGRVGVAFCEGEEVEVGVADVEVLWVRRRGESAGAGAWGWAEGVWGKRHGERVELVVVVWLSLGSWLRGEGGRGTYVYAFVGETGRDGGALFFGFGKEDGEFLDGGHGYVAAVVAGEEGLN